MSGKGLWFSKRAGCDGRRVGHPQGRRPGAESTRQERDRKLFPEELEQRVVLANLSSPWSALSDLNLISDPQPLHRAEVTLRTAGDGAGANWLQIITTQS